MMVRGSASSQRPKPFTIGSGNTAEVTLVPNKVLMTQP